MEDFLDDDIMFNWVQVSLSPPLTPPTAVDEKLLRMIVPGS